MVPSCFDDYFNPVSSIHSYYTRQSQNDNLFVKSVHTTQVRLYSLSSRVLGLSLCCLIIQLLTKTPLLCLSNTKVKNSIRLEVYVTGNTVNIYDKLLLAIFLVPFLNMLCSSKNGIFNCIYLQFLTSDWSKERVNNWAAQVFDENVAEKFLAKEMTGATLFRERITGVESMEHLGLLTLRNQENFRSLVEQLKG